ncbi:MAG: hypothetical protein MPJ50_01800 [Pirellulales bacterium]|nr:hypothetical protein [Pirellulales bacterium]
MADKPSSTPSNLQSPPGKDPTTSPRRISTLFATIADWPVITLLIVLVGVSLAGWWLSHDSVPGDIAIAAGPPGQAYERAGIALEAVLENRFPNSTVIHRSNLAGSPENAALLRERGVIATIEDDRGKRPVSPNLAILQERDLSRKNQQGTQDIVAVAPLFRAVVCVAVDKSVLNKTENEFQQLNPNDPDYQFTVSSILRETMAHEHRVDAGLLGSGARRVADVIARHYRSGLKAGGPQQLTPAKLSPEDSDGDGNPVAKQSSAGVVRVRETAWLDEATLELLRNNEIELVSIDAAALAQQSAFEIVTIPPGAYGYDKHGERIPRHEITTIGSADFVAVRSDASEALVTAILDSIYGDPVGFASQLNEMRDETARPPIQLISQTEVLSQYLNSSFHPAAQAYFQPFDPSELATWTELLAGGKDLLVAFAAGMFLLYGFRTRMVRRRDEAQVIEEKEVLDEYLEQTIKLESEQWNCRDPDKLEEILAKITAIKIEALHKLSHEDLRSDRTFSIFLMQCANVINKIQMKILAYRGGDAHKKQRGGTD